MSFTEGNGPVCKDCRAPQPDTSYSCLGCSSTDPWVLEGFQGCSKCRPVICRGKTCALGLFFTSIVVSSVGLVTEGVGSSGGVSAARSYHIQEAPGAMEKLAEMAPTDYYYDSLLAYLVRKYPLADKHLLDHLVTLEAGQEYSGGLLIRRRQGVRGRHGGKAVGALCVPQRHPS